MLKPISTLRCLSMRRSVRWRQGMHDDRSETSAMRTTYAKLTMTAQYAGASVLELADRIGLTEVTDY
jgi:hypothetical protein